MALFVSLVSDVLFQDDSDFIRVFASNERIYMLSKALFQFIDFGWTAILKSRFQILLGNHDLDQAFENLFQRTDQCRIDRIVQTSSFKELLNCCFVIHLKQFHVSLRNGVLQIGQNDLRPVLQYLIKLIVN